MIWVPRLTYENDKPYFDFGDIIVESFECPICKNISQINEKIIVGIGFYDCKYKNVISFYEKELFKGSYVSTEKNK